MARTAVVNPRRRRKKKASGTRRRRRRNMYGAAAARTPNPRPRRRRRRYAAARRRRNPGTSIRRSNPGMFGLDIDNLIETVPAATGGVFAARYATKLAGPMTEGPGIKHAIAIFIAAHFGGKMLGDLLGSSQKGDFARIAALGWGGDLFARKRFLATNQWVQQNLTLEGVDDPDVYDYSEGEDLNGFQADTQLGDSYVDAVGNRYVRTARGWALSGVGAELVQDDAGNVYQLGDGSGYQYPADYDAIMEDAGMSGFQASSPLGFYPARSNGSSSFGYA